MIRQIGVLNNFQKQRTDVPRVASEISIGGYSGVSGGEASTRDLKCI